MRAATALLGGALAAAVALLAVYLALGGASYEPLRVADPCRDHPWRGHGSLTNRITRSALDGAACSLGISRETLALGLSNGVSIDALSRTYHLPRARVEAAVRAGVNRAIADAERAGAINGLAAEALRLVVGAVPVDRLLQALRGSTLG